MRSAKRTPCAEHMLFAAYWLAEVGPLAFRQVSESELRCVASCSYRRPRRRLPPYFRAPSFRDGPKDQTSDAQLRIGESRDSTMRNCALGVALRAPRNDDASCHDLLRELLAVAYSQDQFEKSFSNCGTPFQTPFSFLLMTVGHCGWNRKPATASDASMR